MQDTPAAKSPIIPIQLSSQDTLQFNCHKGVTCFTECCRHIDITLTPYDIVRLKQRLGMTSTEFLAQYTVPYEMDGHGMPGVKLRTRGNTTECQFLGDRDTGCTVYTDRPTACRYYALGIASMRRMGGATDEDFYFVVREMHCQGHAESKTQTVQEYRQEQGVDVYDELNREWRQIVLKKRSSGPTIGKPSQRSMQLFFMASYDIDRFREFVRSDGFLEMYEVSEEQLATLMGDETELMRFSHKFLKQVLFGEKFLPEKPDALEKRLARRRAGDASDSAVQLQQRIAAEDEKYQLLD